MVKADLCHAGVKDILASNLLEHDWSLFCGVEYKIVLAILGSDITKFDKAVSSCEFEQNRQEDIETAKASPRRWVRLGMILRYKGMSDFPKSARIRL